MKKKARIEKESTPTLENLRRRRIVPKHRVAPGEAKIRVTLWIDADVVREFKGRAEDPGSPKYQTLMNTALRAAAFGESKDSSSLVNNNEFIKAVARKVQAMTARKRASNA
jgi:uncharacterized protein (DUF4415 family)